MLDPIARADEIIAKLSTDKLSQEDIKSIKHEYKELQSNADAMNARNTEIELGKETWATPNMEETIEELNKKLDIINEKLKPKKFGGSKKKYRKTKRRSSKRRKTKKH